MKNTFEKIYDIVRQVPFGKVATYGQIARIAGNPRLSRVVGYAMNVSPENVPCHRVVNRCGGLSDAFSPFGKESHRLLLEIEGVEFKADGCVDMERYLWQEI